MRKRKTGSFFKVIAMVVFVLGATHLAAGQSKQPDDRETLQSLLTEVRMLRQALQTLQRMSLDTYRSQLMVDRIRVSQEGVRRIAATLNETRDTITKIQITIPRNIDDQKMMEGQLQTEVDPAKRSLIELELKRSKEAVESYKSQLERLKERETDLSQELRANQAKLDDLESRLSLLERNIDNDREKVEPDKPEQVKKP